MEDKRVEYFKQQVDILLEKLSLEIDRYSNIILFRDTVTGEIVEGILYDIEYFGEGDYL